MGMDALGRVLNVHPVADDVYVSLRDAGAVTFVGVNTAGETYTLTEDSGELDLEDRKSVV